MRLRSLKHLLEITRALAEPRRIVIIGSASLLPDHPELGEPGKPLDASYDADFLLDPIDEELAAILGEAVGQQSLFTKRHGYYADILRPVMAETLPAGWQSRLHPVVGYDNVFALDPYDRAIVGEREAMDAGRNLTLVLRETGEKRSRDLQSQQKILRSRFGCFIKAFQQPDSARQRSGETSTGSAFVS